MRSIRRIATALLAVWLVWASRAALGEVQPGQSTADAASPSDLPVRVNSVGYLPEFPKRATFVGESAAFRVLKLPDGAGVLKGISSAATYRTETGELLSTIDFSTLSREGVYRLEVDGVGASPEFRVATDVYNSPFYTVMRGMYLWRCGTAVSGRHEGEKFAHAACHLQDARAEVVGADDLVMDGVGGWHDAGDYNKYVVNAGVTAGTMLMAWDHFGDRLESLVLDIPESDNGVPDYLDELRWELAWVLKMQLPDGRVSHKLTTRDFGGFMAPEEETAPRYFTPPSSAATAGFTAMMAAASRAYAPYDREFSETCLAAARKSYSVLADRPENKRADLEGFSTGGYQTNDADDRLWAAAEMWRATGESAFLRDLEQRVGDALAKSPAHGPLIQGDWDWSEVGNLALVPYALCDDSARDAQLVQRIRRDIVDVADSIVETSAAHGYGRPLGERYYWGANGTVARLTVLLEAANRIDPDSQYRATHLAAVDWLLGRNYYGRSFVTGLGHAPPRHPHDRRNGIGGVTRPWPGYLVGGGWPTARDWKDEQASYQTNEIAVNWNAALIYALAPLVEPSTFDEIRTNRRDPSP